MPAVTVGAVPRFCLLLTLFLLLSSHTAAAFDCSDCHGTRVPKDFRPLDDTKRNINTGGFPGNHQSHMSPTTSASFCAKCHPDSSGYTTAHRDGSIKVSSRMNGSPLLTTYRNMTTAFLQTPTPTLGSCANVNCHFERETDSWGAPYFNADTKCTSCHGAPPTGMAPAFIGGASGSHGRHNLYYTGTENCVKCHSDHTADTSHFAHATSAGSRALVVRPRDPLNTSYGSYSTASLTDYLPSQAAGHAFGTCTNTYCHSSVQADGGVDAPISGSPVWGTYLSECNATCHGVGNHGDAAPITTGSHTRHLAYSFKQSGPKLVKRCPTCHLWNPAPTAASTDCAGCHSTGLRPPEIFAKHVNGRIDIAFNPNFTLGTYNGSATPVEKTPRSGYSACSNTYCHSSGASVATGTIPGNTSPTWGSGALACNSCHGNPPSYESGLPKKNSHAKHNTYGYGCNRCHYATTSDGTTIGDTATHVNLAYNVTASPGTFINYSFARTGGTCLSNSCHNDGTAIVTGSLVTARATWGAALPKDAYECYGCHDGRPNYTSGSPKGNSHQIYPHNAYECSRCHGTSTIDYEISDPTKHANGAYDVAPSFAGLFSYTFSPSGGGCSATLCHGSHGYLKWGGIECSDCHEASPDPATHRKHAGVTPVPTVYGDLAFSQFSSASGTVNHYGCGNCHARNVASHPNIRSGFSVVQLYDAQAPAGSLKALNPSTAAYKGPGSISSTLGVDSRGHEYFNGSCNNIYCHSSGVWPSQGMPPAYTRSYKELKWNAQLPAGCTGCHGYPPLPGGVGQINGHSSHTTFGCNVCHFTATRNGTSIAATSVHVNGTFDVAANGSASFTYTYSKLGSRCSDVSCHSIESKNTNWGGVAMEPATFFPAPAAPGVPVGAAIMVTFAEDMDTATVTSGTVQLGSTSGTVSYNAATRTAVFAPSEPLAANTAYTATITTGLRNQLGKALPRNYTWSFTTGN